MLKDLVKQLCGNRLVVSAAPGNGVSSFTLYMVNTILEEDKAVLYYNPTADIDREFVRTYYPRAYNGTEFLTCPLTDFLEYVQYSNGFFDCVVLDPGDTTMIEPDIVPTLGLLRKANSTLIVTSQIRQDPNKGWAPYSTIEKLDSFDYSIWITNVTGGHPIFKQKYVDVYPTIRSGNNFVMRDVAYFTKEGNIIEIQ